MGAPARAGVVAPIDVVIQPGSTGLDPALTSFFQVCIHTSPPPASFRPIASQFCLFFQVLNIPTKINKGAVEIVVPVQLVKKGDKVGSSEAALLAKLGKKSFSYGLVVLSVSDNGSVFSPKVLDLTDDDLAEKFSAGVSMKASITGHLIPYTCCCTPYVH